MTPPAIAEHATVLLQAAARGDQAAWAAYSELIFPELLRTVRHRAQMLVTRAARVIGVPALRVPDVPQRDLEDLASEVATHALERVKRTASSFDASRGDGYSWALGAAALSYVDVVRRGSWARADLTEVLLDDDDWARIETVTPGPELRAEHVTALEQALSRLTEDERFVILAKLHYGLSYSEIALYRFGDKAGTKRVDRLLQSARAKLRAAESEWHGDGAA